MLYLLFYIFLFGLLFFAYFVFPLFIKRRYKGELSKLSGNQVYLTFDDGPDPDSTSAILDILKEHNIKAVFFVIANRAEKHPEIIERMIEEGHLVGNHSYNHLNAIKSEPFRYWFDLKKSHSVLQKFNLSKPVLFRPPFGKFNLFTLTFIQLGYKVLLWNCDPQDFNQQDDQNIINYISENAGPGSVILLHDARVGQRYSAEITIRALPKLIENLKQKNFEFGLPEIN